MRSYRSEEWQRTCLRWLEKSFGEINEENLGGVLRLPQFSIDESIRRLGRWDPHTRTIGLSARHLLNDLWLDVELTLRHEMAHQYVSEVLKGDPAKPHGALFKRACALLHLESSPRFEAARDPAIERIYQRVQKLMQLSASSSQNEAESAVSAAHRLLLKHNLSLHDEEGERHFSYRWIGPPRGRIPLEAKILSGLLQDHFFVRGIWVQTLKLNANKPLQVLEILGRAENLELAEYTHEFLTRTLDELWKSYRLGLNTEKRGRAVRNAYRIGVLMGLRERLEKDQSKHTEQGLIWLGDSAIDEFVAVRYPRTHTMRGGRYRVGEAHDAGRKEGNRLKIRPGLRGNRESRTQLKRVRKKLSFRA